MESHAFPQSTARIRSDEPGLQTSTGKGKPSQYTLHEIQENPASSTTGYVREAVVPEIQASPREDGLLPTFIRTGPLDRDSTVILPGDGPLSPLQGKCKSYSETVPMSNTWSDDLMTSTPVSIQQTLPPDWHNFQSPANVHAGKWPSA